MFPIAIAAGNTFVLKPSPQTPLTSDLLFRDRALRRLSERHTQRRARRSGDVGSADRPPGGRRRLVRRLFKCRARRCKSAPCAPTSESKRSAAQRTISSSCPTPLTAQPAMRSFQPLSAAPDSAVWRARFWWRSATRATESLRCWRRLLRSLQFGRGADDGVEMGPVVSDDALARINGYIERAITAGAQMPLAGRQRPRSGGAFLSPVIFDRVDPYERVGARRNFWAGAGDRSRRVAGRSNRNRELARATATRRRSSPQTAAAARSVRLAHRGRHGRHQRRHRRADGVLSVRRRQRFDLRRPSLPWQGRGCILHAAARRHQPLAFLSRYAIAPATINAKK